jgi:hypothetical protein
MDAPSLDSDDDPLEVVITHSALSDEMLVEALKVPKGTTSKPRFVVKGLAVTFCYSPHLIALNRPCVARHLFFITAAVAKKRKPSISYSLHYSLLLLRLLLLCCIPAGFGELVRF